MKQIFVETGNTTRAREAISVLEDTEIGQPGIGCFYGEAGRGKTVFSRMYAVQSGAIYLRVMEDWTARAMLGALCRELNGSDPRSVERCKQIACKELEGQQRTMLVDEADRLNVGLIEHLRDIHDITGCPIILVGEEHLFPTLSARRRLWDRVTQVVEFRPISAEDVILFALKAADLRISPEAAQRIEQRSGGTFRRIWTDIHHLEQMARAAGTRNVELKMLGSLPQAAPRSRARGGRNGN